MYNKFERHQAASCPSWSSFGTAQRRENAPATLSKALSRPCLVYPSASLDVSGQRPVSCADASPNEVLFVRRNYTIITSYVKKTLVTS